MKALKVCTLFIASAISLTASAQRTTKHTSSSKPATVAATDSIAPSPSTLPSAPLTPAPAPALPPQPPMVMMKYFVNAYPEYTTFVKAINAVELNSTFEDPGPVTVFAPVNRTFDNLPPGTIRNILKPEMRDSLKGIITYMVLAGKWRVSDLQQKIKEGGGSATLPTVGSMGMLTFTMNGNSVWIKDKRGTQIELGVPVIMQNGIVYPVDRLLLP
jgi:uncharacterized surface protein with fasciclin (FAS1) repeats